MTMRYPWIGWMAWAGVWILTTAASPVDGVREAREWQHTADIAGVFKQWDAAYTYYQRTAEAFPETPHGRFCAERATGVEDALLQVVGAPGSERWETWRDELIDFFTWP